MIKVDVYSVKLDYKNGEKEFVSFGVPYFQTPELALKAFVDFIVSLKRDNAIDLKYAKWSLLKIGHYYPELGKIKGTKQKLIIDTENVQLLNEVKFLLEKELKELKKQVKKDGK